MNKRLLIMRHAKSSWATEGLADFDRPLNPRGKRDAPRMARWIAQQGNQPELIACSTAARAMETAKLFIENCDGMRPEQCVEVDDFYHAMPHVYLDYLAKIDDQDLNCIMVLGHNPGLAHLVYQLSGRPETMPTAAIAVLDFQMERWSEIEDAPRLKSIHVARPKEMDQ